MCIDYDERIVVVVVDAKSSSSSDDARISPPRKSDADARRFAPSAPKQNQRRARSRRAVGARAVSHGGRARVRVIDGAIHALWHAFVSLPERPSKET